MKIELVDRDHWIERAKTGLDQIADRRAKEDASYEALWTRKRESRGRWRFLIGPISEKPPHGHQDFGCSGFYPSIYAWGDDAKLKSILAALQRPHTGTIFIDADEMRALS